MTTTTDVRPPPVRATHFRLAVLALAVGGFAIGTTEFVTMGLLPQISEGVGVSIPQAGHIIAAYALGVVVGAPVLAFFGAKWPRRGLLVVLMGAYALFNALSAVATNFEMLVVARFLDGLPHGGYFGVASLVAASMVAPERRGRAMAWVLLAFWAVAPYGWVALPAAFAVTFVGSVLALSMMVRLIDVAGHAQTLGAAMSHSSLNVGNALGAWLGGLVIAAGLGFRAPILVGVALAVAGFLVVVASAVVQNGRSEPGRG